MANVVNLALRGFQFIWTLLIMSLVGNMIATAYHNNPSIVNYDLFVSVFAMASLLYLIPCAFNENFGFHPLLPVLLDLLNTLFFFCGAVATAAYLGVHSCSNSAYTHSNKVTNGSHNTAKRCREAQASTAFLWFGFACFAASTFFSFLASRGSGGISRGPSRRPNMSQV